MVFFKKTGHFTNIMLKGSTIHLLLKLYIMEKNLLSISENFDVFLIDLYGTIWNGTAFFPQALNVLAALVKQGKTVILLSNYPQRAARVADIYEKEGLIPGCHYHHFVTSGELAYQIFSHDSVRLKYSVIGRRDNPVFADSNYTFVSRHSSADIIYLGNPQRFVGGSWCDIDNMDFLEGELQQVLNLKKPFLCVNPDRKSHTGDEREMVLRAGSLAVYCERHGGKVEYLGKPDKRIFDFALNGINVPKDRIIIVGDALETDILGGIRAGIKTALVKTGVSYDDMQHSSQYSLSDYMYHRGIAADYILEHV